MCLLVGLRSCEDQGRVHSSEVPWVASANLSATSATTTADIQVCQGQGQPRRSPGGSTEQGLHVGDGPRSVERFHGPVGRCPQIRAGESEACSQSTTVEGADHFDPRFHPTFRETRRRIRSRGYSRVQVARGGPGAVAPGIGDGHNPRSRNLWGIGPRGHERHWVGDWGHQGAHWDTLFVIRDNHIFCLQHVGARCHCLGRIHHWASTGLQSLSTRVERDRLRLKQGPSLFNRLLRSTLGPGFVASPTHDPRYPHPADGTPRTH